MILDHMAGKARFTCRTFFCLPTLSSKTVTNQLRDSLHDLNGPLDELKDKWDCDRLSPTLHWRLTSCRDVLSLVPQDEIGTGKNDKMLKSGKSR
ncbi:hypothetical protein I7I50_12467 [Histoplasma capsulatum G186AR]|uniref:Uncharacterized protein n=1 Tax=Ajellomyces capsulatus TaxID=5037 RepID=A0A8H7YA07_AJECA|nr:hypothetical protein I7I52_11226 [Histoplasma capsulatum]QSS70736.1 hypothetical protein I7I50_12467 [Histoplasma capsulatum G186AR]